MDGPSTELRAKRLGWMFGAEPALLIRIPADLSEIKRLAAKHTGFQGTNGEMRPLEDRQLKEEVFRILNLPAEAHYAMQPIVRKHPWTASGRYDSRFLHSDVWSGNPAGFMAMFPVSGDFEHSGVEFYKPTKSLEKLNQVYKYYSSAPDFAPQYLGRMEEGFIHIVDAFCLHKTMNGVNERISVDARFAYKDGFMKYQKRMNYFPIGGKRRKTWT